MSRAPYQPVHDPPDNELMDRAIDNLDAVDQLRVNRAIRDVTGISRGFGTVGAKEFMCKLGMYMIAKEKMGEGMRKVSLADNRVMRAILRDDY